MRIITPSSKSTYFCNRSNTPPEGKIYRKQELSAARTLVKHGDWYAETYPEGDLQATMDWYRAVLPKDLIEGATAKLTNPAAVSALTPEPS